MIILEIIGMIIDSAMILALFTADLIIWSLVILQMKG